MEPNKVALNYRNIDRNMPHIQLRLNYNKLSITWGIMSLNKRKFF